MTDFIQAFTRATCFLTLIPIRGASAGHAHDITQSLFVFPLVGLLIGVLSAGLGALAGELFGTPLHIAVALAASAIITSGFHLDGLADTCDALFSWRSRERKLEIMKDSRIGVMGALALILDFVLKTAALVALGELWWIGAIVAPVWGRWADVYGIIGFPTAKSEGMASDVQTQISKNQFWIASTITIALTLPLFYYSVLSLAIAFAAVAVLIHWLAAAMARSLGGLTGDTYGALSEIGEVLSLLALCYALN